MNRLPWALPKKHKQTLNLNSYLRVVKITPSQSQPHHLDTHTHTQTHLFCELMEKNMNAPCDSLGHVQMCCVPMLNSPNWNSRIDMPLRCKHWELATKWRVWNSLEQLQPQSWLYYSRSMNSIDVRAKICRCHQFYQMTQSGKPTLSHSASLIRIQRLIFGTGRVQSRSSSLWFWSREYIHKNVDPHALALLSFEFWRWVWTTPFWISLRWLVWNGPLQWRKIV